MVFRAEGSELEVSKPWCEETSVPLHAVILSNDRRICLGGVPSGLPLSSGSVAFFPSRRPAEMNPELLVFTPDTKDPYYRTVPTYENDKYSTVVLRIRIFFNSYAGISIKT